MTLAEYLAEAGLTQYAFAERAGITQAYVSRLVTGASLAVSRDVAGRIYEATGGAVTPNDIFLSPKTKEAAE
jgi:3,4-dihydroxy 2-butanone 4-phosphate synthase/GTP cyclohydrolase II